MTWTFATRAALDTAGGPVLTSGTSSARPPALAPAAVAAALDLVPIARDAAGARYQAYLLTPKKNAPSAPLDEMRGALLADPCDRMRARRR